MPPLLSTLGADAKSAYGVGGITATNIGTLSFSAYTAGVSAGGGGPTGQPGTQYKVNGSVSTRLSYATATRTWSADSGTTNFAWTRSVAFINPYSAISNETLDNWGFLNTDVVRATDIGLTRAVGAVDGTVWFYYAKITNGAPNISYYSNVIELTRGVGDGPGRQGFEWNGFASIPNPGVDEMYCVFVFSDSGYQTTTLNFRCTQWSISG
jgi:hypothetical protein